MKTCSKCLITYTIDNFHKRSKSIDGLHAWCKTCRNEYDRSRYKRIGSSLWVRNRKLDRQRKRIWLDKYKSDKACSVCGETHIACLEFDHVDSHDKISNVSDLVGSGRSYDAIMKEIKKCVILCANCHRKRHYNERIRDVD